MDADSTPISHGEFRELVLDAVRLGAPEQNIEWISDEGIDKWKIGSLTVSMSEGAGGAVVTSNRVASQLLGSEGLPSLPFALNRHGAALCAAKIIDDLHNPYMTS